MSLADLIKPKAARYQTHQTSQVSQVSQSVASLAAQSREDEGRAIAGLESNTSSSVATVATVATGSAGKKKTAPATPATDAERQAITAWLTSIGETDQAIISEVMELVDGSMDARRYYLERSREVTATPATPRPATPATPPPPIRTCGDCSHFQRDRINPASGLGYCKAETHKRHPAARRHCGHWLEVTHAA